MNNISIIKILREGAFILKHEFDSSTLRFVEVNNRTYDRHHFLEYKTDLTEAASKIRILIIDQTQPAETLAGYIQKNKVVTLVFQEQGDNLIPTLLYTDGRNIQARAINGEQVTTPDDNFDLTTLYKDDRGEVITVILHPYQSLVSEYSYEGDSTPEPLTPLKRFFRMLGTEKRDIFYILVYSVFIGLTTLILPVGIQNTIKLISGGVFFNSIYVLIAAIILGILLTGILQIIQVTLVEYLQRRVFTKAALEFAFRIPRIRIESILKNYAPELVNRFFDVLTLQKGLPKLLIDLVSAVVQILFGLILLSLYHPFFVFFSIVLVLLLYLIFSLTASSGLKSSIKESKYKYKVAQWLEELARAMNSFKLAGTTELPTRKADDSVNNYLKYRKAHFKVLLTQFWFIVIFKTAVVASILILGTILVISREITLGQFVAAEVIVILILGAVEKVITNMDVIYDLLTAVDKIAQITDLPLEKVGGLDFPKGKVDGYAVVVKDLKYRYPDKSKYTLTGINLNVQPGEKVCIAGPGGSGRSTLTNLLSGMHSNYEGVISINNYSMRDLDIRHLRDSIARNISPEEIFDGTILENITLNSPTRMVDDAMSAIRKVRLEDDINRLPEGLSTPIVSGGKGFSTSFIHKLILARCLTKKPSLIILNDYFSGLKRQERLELLQSVINDETRWTLVAVSNDPLVMAACDRVILLSDGAVSDEGHFNDLLRKGTINNYID